MLLTDLVQDPFEGLIDEKKTESRAVAEGRQAVIEVVSEVQEESGAASGTAQGEDD